MISKGKNAPISGGKGQFAKTPNILNDAARPSRTAQRQILQPPAPFQNPGGILGVPAPVHPSYRAASDFSKQGLAYGAKGKPVGAANTRKIDLSGVGYAKPYTSNRGIGPVNSGFPLSAQRVVGGGNQPSAKWGPKAPSAKQRKEYPGIFGRGR